MRKHFQKLKAICILCILLISNGLNGQDFSLLPPRDCPFYYMDDDKVFYQGEEVYLKTCNYLISMQLCNGEIVVGPHHGYFKDNHIAEYPSAQEGLNSTKAC